MWDVLGEIAKERNRQIRKGWDEEHDDGHADGSLLHASVLTMCEVGGLALAGVDAPDINGPWPDQFIMRLAEKMRDNPRQMLIIAAALLVAEIERMDRASEEGVGYDG